LSNLTGNKILRILSYNLQVGIKTSRPSQYFTGSWKHLIPHSQRLINLDDTIHFLESYDIVGLQETDAGIEVSAVDPMASMQAIENPDLGGIAAQVQAKLKSVIESL